MRSWEPKPRHLHRKISLDLASLCTRTTACAKELTFESRRGSAPKERFAQSARPRPLNAFLARLRPSQSRRAALYVRKGIIKSSMARLRAWVASLDSTASAGRQSRRRAQRVLPQTRRGCRAKGTAPWCPSTSGHHLAALCRRNARRPDFTAQVPQRINFTVVRSQSSCLSVAQPSRRRLWL